MQRDLDALMDWGSTWGMKFNAKMCNICQMSNRTNRENTLNRTNRENTS